MSDIDFGQLSEALNDKSDRDLRNVDITAKADAVIDFQLPTADNGYTWYRLYASGWVEQGGQGIASNSTTTVSLPIEMANNKYTATGSIIYGGTSSGTVGLQFVKNTTSIVIGARWNGAFNNGLAVDWQVSGLSAN